MMGLHKLTAGDGYTYLTRQVAVHDSTEKGRTGLADYYAQSGESPGAWLGAGLAGLELAMGDSVTAGQMAALFGAGRHPNPAGVQAAVLATGGSTADAARAVSLGRAFATYSGASALRVEVARRFTAYNLGRNERWNAAIPVEVRAQIRTAAGRDLFGAAFGRSPADDRELSGFIAVASRQTTTAVAGFDLTFSPVKSVSALWALAPPAIAREIERAHAAAVEDTLAWLERHAAYTRHGAGGVRQVDVRGLVAAAFTHRDSRAGDPDLHTHLAVSNKVQDHTGRWLALDGRILYQAKVSASERYNTRLEAELVNRIGVRFLADHRSRHDGAASRQVREISGVAPELLAAWSKRRAAIDTRRGELATRFHAAHGRHPTAVEALALAQQATLETRAGKHAPRSFAAQRASWHAEAAHLLGGADAVEAMLHAALPTALHSSSGAGQASGQVPRQLPDRWILQTAHSVIHSVQSARATWQEWHIRAEAERQIRTAALPRALVDQAVDAVVTAALAPSQSIRLGPNDPVGVPDPTELPQLRRADGSSVYCVAGADTYTSPAVLDAEHRLLHAATQRGGHTISTAAVSAALAEAARTGLPLSPSQVQLVRELTSSGARLQLAIAPAGAGKTTAMRALAHAWRRGGGTILGLAPSAAAAAELRSQLAADTDTLAKLVHSLHGPAGEPGWLRRIDRYTLVIVDEAGMAATSELAEGVDTVLARGGSVRLVGDDRQLAAISAGGILRDIADQAGVVTLSELHRFSDRAEAAATLALRTGDPAALGFYLDNDRVHVGDLATVTDHAYRAWSADRAAGRDAVLLAPTRAIAAQLNARAHTEHPRPSGQGEVHLSDGTCAGIDEPVITRRNDRRLRTSRTDWVKNGDRWTITALTTAGDLTVRHARTGRQVRLPASYVSQHVCLGYATTIHAAQGITAEVAHTVAAGAETRQLLYVAMTRGRRANHVYLATVGDGDEHSLIRPEAVLPPTGTDILTAILARDGSQHSATSTAAAVGDAAANLHDAVLRYRDALTLAAEDTLGPATLADLDHAANQLHPGLAGAAAYPTLRANLAVLAVDTATPSTELLTTALRVGELDSALDPAAVLTWRLPRPARPGPLPWLEPIPDPLRSHPAWGRYLTARADLIHHLATQVRDTATSHTSLTAPAWAAGLLGQDSEALRCDLAVWRAAYALDDTDPRPTGPVQPANAPRQYQRDLDHHVAQVLTDPSGAAAAWTVLARHIEPRLVADPAWPGLAARLARIDQAGIPLRRLLSTVADTKPLPDDHPAAALWWRLARHLSVAAVAADDRSGADTLRPDWTTTLIDVLGPARAEQVMVGPSWPALVAAITAASSTADAISATPPEIAAGPAAGWTAAQLIATAADLALAAEHAHPTTPIPPSATELGDALVWHVAMLTDPAPIDDEAASSDPVAADPFASAPSLSPPLPPAPRIDACSESAGPAHDHESLQWDALLEEHKWATAPVSKQRLLELNHQALDYYAARYPTSWARDYLHRRLGVDLGGPASPVATFSVGYAPDQWTALTTHLRRHGATDQELLAAGLARPARTGRLIDMFRDRLVFPLYQGSDLVGFIGRRNPSHDTAPASAAANRAGPKYLNTPHTDLYTKATHLFGLTESAAALTAAATPVITEGPIDAIAITLAGHGDYIGVAPLGTALTWQHTDQLAPYLGHGVVLATDADPAGRSAAARSYWQLTALRASPRALDLPAGSDPADLLHRAGPNRMHQALHAAGPLAHRLIDAAAAFEAPDTLDRIGEVIAALPPTDWPAAISHAATVLATPRSTMEKTVLGHAEAWTLAPRAAARRQLDATTQAPPIVVTETPPNTTGRRDTGPAPSSAPPSTPSTNRSAHPRATSTPVEGIDCIDHSR